MAEETKTTAGNEAQSTAMSPEQMIQMMQQVMSQPQTTPQQPQAQGGFMGGWSQPQAQPVQVAAAEKVLVPVELSMNFGKVTIYLQFPGEMAASPQTLTNTVQYMKDQNIPVKAWVPKGGGSSNGYGNK